MKQISSRLFQQLPVAFKIEPITYFQLKWEATTFEVPSSPPIEFILRPEHNRTVERPRVRNKAFDTK